MIIGNSLVKKHVMHHIVPRTEVTKHHEAHSYHIYKRSLGVADHFPIVVGSILSASHKSDFKLCSKFSMVSGLDYWGFIATV